MKKILITLVLCCLLISCLKKPVPIEKHKGTIVTNKGIYDNGHQAIEVKCKDSIYNIVVTEYDSGRFNIGDTINKLRLSRN
mgnify:CR=1 FL=1